MKTQKSFQAKWLLVILTMTLISFDLPDNWFVAGTQPQNYFMDIDIDMKRLDTNVMTIKSIVPEITGFGTIMKNTPVNEYAGKRVRMTGYVKTADVANWAGLWLRVDKKEPYEVLSFDNMHDGKTDRSITGTNDWKKYEIVLDVPQTAINLAYGVLLAGTGQVWFDEISFETVDESVPTTGRE
ncbi:MAG TPA: hypothetical protein VK179_16735 [Bacteroidales bacterium]|nr:hypothetical protein [Bacteroidales bacterium]